MKIQKRYYILIFVLAITAGVLLSELKEQSFTIVRNQTAYAPEYETVYAENDEKININEADIYELDELYGIGEGFARRIIEYREKKGKFETIQDIMKVSGIGEEIFGKIKDYICVD